MATTYFIDESGNSGDIATGQALQNFGGQPFFSLACIGVEDKQALDDFAAYIIRKYKIQANELKSTSICLRKRYILPEVIDFLIKDSCNILIEVVNKRYQICGSLMDYYIISPYLDNGEYNIEDGIMFKKNICDFIYNNIDDIHLKDFIDAFSLPDDDVSCIDICLQNMKLICKKHGTISNELMSFVDDVIDIFEDMKQHVGNSETRKRFLPCPDYSGEKKYGILPNVNCLTNIYARINMIEKGTKHISVFHDEQKEFNTPLDDAIKLVENLSTENSLVTKFADFNISEPIRLSFVPSKGEYGVQLADLIAGTFMRHVHSVSVNSQVYSEFADVYQKIVSHVLPVNVGVNLVIPTSDIIKLANCRTA